MASHSEKNSWSGHSEKSVGLAIQKKTDGLAMANYFFLNGQASCFFSEWPDQLFFSDWPGQLFFSEWPGQLFFSSAITALRKATFFEKSWHHAEKPFLRWLCWGLALEASCFFLKRKNLEEFRLFYTKVDASLSDFGKVHFYIVLDFYFIFKNSWPGHLEKIVDGWLVP